jgi:AcrR family transcriptional regulator
MRTAQTPPLEIDEITIVAREGSMRAEKKGKRRAEVLHLSAKLFSERGYEAVSVRDIADAVGLTMPSLYRYIGNKSQLLQDLAVTLADEWVERLEEAARSPGDAEARLRSYLRAALGVVESRQAEMALTLHENRSQSAEARAELQKRTRRIKQALRNILESGREEGLWRDVPLTSVYLMIFGMVNWSVNWYRSDGPKSSRELADDFSDILLGGLRASMASVEESLARHVTPANGPLTGDVVIPSLGPRSRRSSKAKEGRGSRSGKHITKSVI